MNTKMKGNSRPESIKNKLILKNEKKTNIKIRVKIIFFRTLFLKNVDQTG